MKRKAIVIGGSVAGLAAAAAITPFFDEVTIVERDVLDDHGELSPRRYAPQGAFVHSLLERGRRELEALFPGLSRALVDAGAPLLDFGSDVAALRETCWIRPSPLGIKTLWPSRPLLERSVREICKSRYPVEFVTSTKACGVSVSGAGAARRVDGVLVERAGREELLRADLVVDAAGRSSNVLTWLARHGIAPPPEERVDARAGYSSRLYEAPQVPTDVWWRAIVIECSPPDVLVGGVLFPIEGNRWLVTLQGFNGAYPPSDEAGFCDFARSLRSPILAEAIDRARPLGRVITTRGFVNRFRRYDLWRERPAGLVALGDSVCAFNPIYGQGMSAAASCARLLAESLERWRDAPTVMARAFFDQQRAFLATPWHSATASDFRYPKTLGSRQDRSLVRERYLSAVFEAAWRDPILHRRVAEVCHLVAPPRILFAPTTVLRAAAGTMAYGLRRLSGRAAPAPRPPRAGARSTRGRSSPEGAPLEAAFVTPRGAS